MKKIKLFKSFRAQLKEELDKELGSLETANRWADRCGQSTSYINGKISAYSEIIKKL